MSINWNATTTPLVPYKFNCCTIGNTSGTTCQYKSGSPECHAVMKEVCKSPRMGGSAGCKDWANRYPAVAEATVREYCLYNGGRTTDPWCACILSKAGMGIGGQINPLCIDQKCIASGSFKPESLVRLGCPDVTECNQIINMQNIGLSIAPEALANSNCGKTNPPANINNENNWSLIILFMIIVAAITIAIIWRLSRRSHTTS